MKNILVSTLYLVLALALIIGGVIVFSWQYGVFKEATSLNEESLKIQEKANFIQEYPFQEANNYLLQLPQEKIEVPPIATHELGRTNLFVVETSLPVSTVTTSSQELIKLQQKFRSR